MTGAAGETGFMLSYNMYPMCHSIVPSIGRLDCQINKSNMYMEMYVCMYAVGYILIQVILCTSVVMFNIRSMVIPKNKR